MNWTTEHPTKEGWYWFLSSSGHVTISKIESAGARLLAEPHETEDDQQFVEKLEGYWCGPIQHPPLPDDIKCD
jgi:hypothetical protein